MTVEMCVIGAICPGDNGTEWIWMIIGVISNSRNIIFVYEDQYLDKEHKVTLAEAAPCNE